MSDKQTTKWPTWAHCPHCGWVHDMEGEKDGEPIYCEACHKPFTAEELQHVA